MGSSVAFFGEAGKTVCECEIVKFLLFCFNKKYMIACSYKTYIKKLIQCVSFSRKPSRIEKNKMNAYKCDTQQCKMVKMNAFGMHCARLH